MGQLEQPRVQTITKTKVSVEAIVGIVALVVIASTVIGGFGAVGSYAAAAGAPPKPAADDGSGIVEGPSIDPIVNLGSSNPLVGDSPFSANSTYTFRYRAIIESGGQHIKGLTFSLVAPVGWEFQEYVGESEFTQVPAVGSTGQMVFTSQGPFSESDIISVDFITTTQSATATITAALKFRTEIYGSDGSFITSNMVPILSDSCNDSDGGPADYFNVGTISGVFFGADFSDTDYCPGGSDRYLMEYGCSATSSPIVTRFDCETNTNGACQNDRCIIILPTPTTTPPTSTTTP